MQSVTGLLVKGLLLLSAPLSVAVGMHGQCTPPSSSTKDKVVLYVAKRFHVSASLISITDEEPTGMSCFWAMHLHAIDPPRSLTLYLSPDMNSLAPDLYDMNVDPTLAEKAEREGRKKLLTIENSPERGPRDASINIVEFSDFQCPYCKRMSEQLSALLSRDDPSGQNIRLVYKHFPLPQHTWATTAAVVGTCIQQVDPALFWTYNDYLFNQQSRLTLDNIVGDSLNFIDARDAAKRPLVAACVNGPDARKSVENDVELGKKLGVTATPTLFINGEKIDGAVNASTLQEALSRARAEVASR